MRAFIAAGVVFFSASLCLSAAPALADVQERLKVVLDDVAALTPLRTVVIAHDGETIAERGYGGRLRDITIGHLLSMQAGLERTSGQNYGRWVASRDWVRFVLAQPFADEPGGSMLYSTGSTHLLSAILTRVGGKSTLALAREWFADIDDFSIASWDRDPQGIYFGGNQMAMSPRSLLAFGEMYRKGGVAENGERVVSARWIEESWRVRTHSRFTQDGYGYGWFQRNIAGEDVSYAWGYGGQMLYIVPSVGLTVVMTSDESAPSGRTGHREDLHGVLGRIIEAVKTGDTTSN